MDAHLTSLSDNDFELVPKEAKEIDLQWQQQTPTPNIAVNLIVSAMNSEATSFRFDISMLIRNERHFPT